MRVYEAKGLLGPRGATRSKRYGAPAIDRLRLVVGLRQLDMSIEDIAKLLALHANGHQTVAEAARQVTEAMQQTVKLLDERVEQLTRLRNELLSSTEKLGPCTECGKTLEACRECSVAVSLDPAARTLFLG